MNIIISKLNCKRGTHYFREVLPARSICLSIPRCKLSKFSNCQITLYISNLEYIFSFFLLDQNLKSHFSNYITFYLCKFYFTHFQLHEYNLHFILYWFNPLQVKIVTIAGPPQKRTQYQKINVEFRAGTIQVNKPIPRIDTYLKLKKQ